MKRCIFGAVLLAALLIAGLFAQNCMNALHLPTAALLQEAGECARDNDWLGAESALAQAQSRWQKSQSLTAALADHTPMEDADALFTQLKVFAAERETTHFAALCAELSGRVAAMADAHTLTWQNVL